MGATALLVIPMLLATACCAQDLPPATSAEMAKPACTAQTRGKLWPEKTSRANGVPIEICVQKLWKYRWEQLTVDISQLRANYKPAIPDTAPPKAGTVVAASPAN